MELSERLVSLGAAFFAGVAVMAALGMFVGATFGLTPHPLDVLGLAGGSAIAIALWIRMRR